MSTQVRIKYGSDFFPDPIGAGGRFPTPIINTSTNINKSTNGTVLSTTTSITLNGFILASGESPKYLMQQVSGLQKYFSDPDRQGNAFRVICGESEEVLNFPYVSINNISFDQSNDNWSQKIPYSVTLESVAPGSGFSQLLESVEDSWNIEPLEDVSYYDWRQSTTHKDFITGNGGANPNVSEPPADTSLRNDIQTFNVNNLLQYRITHRLGAVGKPGRTNDPDNPTDPKDLKFGYQQAAEWVRSMLDNSVLNGTSAFPSSGIILNPGINRLHLFNHIRTTEANVAGGSYNVTDTWLAINSGVKFVEDSTWEINTDDKMIKTVTLNGTIKGLEPVDTYRANVPIVTGIISAVSGFPQGNPSIASASNKFVNALSGYVSGVKPYLYRRASMILSAIPGGVEETAPGGTTQFHSDKIFIGPKNNAPLNITPLNYTESINPIAGTVNYNVAYSNRPGSFLSGVLSSTMTVNDTNSVDQVAEIFVLGRQLGPVLQKTGTTKSERRVNVEVVYPAPTGYKQSHPNSPDCPINKENAKYKQLKDFVYSFRPIAADVFATIVPTSSYSIADQGQVFKTSESTNWSPFEGRFSWDVTWIYNTGACT